jgi:MFS family permease
MNASNLTVAVRPLAAEFKTSPTLAGYLVCFNVLCLGVGNIFWVPLSRVIGKRPTYLAAMLVVMGANIWSFFSHTYGSLLASRIVSGFGAAAGDATVPSLVTDLFFVHERGHCMMIFHLALSSGFFLGPMICAWVTQGVGWRWTCCLLAAAAGSAFLFSFFAIRETNYSRRSTDDEALSDSAYPLKRGFGENLSISRGYNKSESFIKTVLRIFTMVAYPPVLWTGLTAGAFVGW